MPAGRRPRGAARASARTTRRRRRTRWRSTTASSRTPSRRACGRAVVARRHLHRAVKAGHARDESDDGASRCETDAERSPRVGAGLARASPSARPRGARGHRRSSSSRRRASRRPRARRRVRQEQAVARPVSPPPRRSARCTTPRTGGAPRARRPTRTRQSSRLTGASGSARAAGGARGAGRRRSLATAHRRVRAGGAAPAGPDDLARQGERPGRRARAARGARPPRRRAAERAPRRPAAARAARRRPTTCASAPARDSGAKSCRTACEGSAVRVGRTHTQWGCIYAEGVVGCGANQKRARAGRHGECRSAQWRRAKQGERAAQPAAPRLRARDRARRDACARSTGLVARRPAPPRAPAAASSRRRASRAAAGKAELGGARVVRAPNAYDLVGARAGRGPVARVRRDGGRVERARPARAAARARVRVGASSAAATGCGGAARPPAVRLKARWSIATPSAHSSTRPTSANDSSAAGAPRAAPCGRAARARSTRGRAASWPGSRARTRRRCSSARTRRAPRPCARS